MNCLFCKGKNITKKGKRKTKYQVQQIYYCKTCKKRFVKKGLENKTYNPVVMINAINYYNLGYTLQEACCLVNRRFSIKISKSALHNWLSEYSHICSFRKIRKQIFLDFKKGEVVFTNCFMHQGLTYVFKYHQGKLKRYAGSYPSLAEYIKHFEQGCSDKMFEDGKRCSQIKLDINIRKYGSNTQACSLAKLALNAVKDNRKRHEVVEEFMLINDTATVACEVPVWFWDKKMDVNISGHIDILQIRAGKIFVLDYKPDASAENENKVASQLYLYVRALSFRTGIPLKCFRCGWFDENDYYEFSPVEALIKKSGR